MVHRQTARQEIVVPGSHRTRLLPSGIDALIALVWLARFEKRGCFSQLSYHTFNVSAGSLFCACGLVCVCRWRGVAAAAASLLLVAGAARTVVRNTQWCGGLSNPPVKQISAQTVKYCCYRPIASDRRPRKALMVHCLRVSPQGIRVMLSHDAFVCNFEIALCKQHSVVLQICSSL